MHSSTRHLHRWGGSPVQGASQTRCVSCHALAFGGFLPMTLTSAAPARAGSSETLLPEGSAGGQWNRPRRVRGQSVAN